MSLLLLVPFVAANIWLIRILFRRIRRAAEFLRAPHDPAKREEAMEEFARDEVVNFLTRGFRTPNYSNPVQWLLIEIGLLGTLFTADYHTIRLLWPWLLR